MLSAAILAAVLLQAAPSAVKPDVRVPAAYEPQRVYDTRRQAFTDFESMLADFSGADVVLIGELHDDPGTHRLEAAILQGLLRRKVPVTVSLEMFERDVQAHLDGYLAGTMSEDEFLKESRPWPGYATDYRPLVEIARENQWRVIAANVPRRIASEVAKAGHETLDGRPETERTLFATDVRCPRDAYFDRFAAQMNSHPAAGQDARAAAEAIERYFWAQCVKDETMAESIVSALAARSDRPGPLVHYNGAFHSDFGLGTAERVRRRLPGRRVVIVSMLPVADLDALAPAGDDLKRADYLVYTFRP